MKEFEGMVQPRLKDSHPLKSPTQEEFLNFLHVTDFSFLYFRWGSASKGVLFK